LITRGVLRTSADAAQDTATIFGKEDCWRARSGVSGWSDVVCLYKARGLSRRPPLWPRSDVNAASSARQAGRPARNRRPPSSGTMLPIRHRTTFFCWRN